MSDPSIRDVDSFAAPNAPSLLRTVGLTKIYPAIAADSRAVGQNTNSSGEVVLFRNLDFSIAAGEMVAIVGESGTGKSSLLHLLAALDRPTAGAVWLAETNLSQLNPMSPCPCLPAASVAPKPSIKPANGSTRSASPPAPTTAPAS
jgi:ABC-type glutathione transport system ATPase component